MAKSNRSTSSAKSTPSKATTSGKSKTYPQVASKSTVKSSVTGRYVSVGAADSVRGGSRVKPESEFQRIINRTVSQVRGIIDSMDADQKEIDSLRVETRANLDKTQAILDTF